MSATAQPQALERSGARGVSATQAVRDHEAWTPVCRRDELIADRGVCALVGERQVAVFLLSGGELFAIDNIDPMCGAAVLSRGLVGSAGDVLTIASPMYKQRFDLRTGRCLDAENVAVAVHPVRVRDGWVEVLVASA